MKGKSITKNLEGYMEFKIQTGLRILEKNLTTTEIKAAAKFHLENTLTKKFQDYYLEILKNEKLLLNKEDYFSVFKVKYSLQRIDNEYLHFLEKSKKHILKLLRNEEFISLYHKYFFKQKIKRKDSYLEIDLNSFFTKFVHTFYPDVFPALDNSTKNLLSFDKGSFIFSFFCISTIYNRFINVNPVTVKTIREIFNNESIKFRSETIAYSDIKLLDLILRRKANLD
jgi:hypothetical protein